MSVDNVSSFAVYKWQVRGESCRECLAMDGVSGTLTWWSMRRKPGFHDHCDCVLVLESEYVPAGGGWNGRGDGIQGSKVSSKEKKHQAIKGGGGGQWAAIRKGSKPKPKPIGNARNIRHPQVGAE